MAEKLHLPLSSDRREIGRAGEAPAVAVGDVSWVGYAAILATYSVSSSTAFMPYIFGILGYVAAPVMLALYFLLCASLQQKVLNIALQNPEAHNMPSLAELVAGRPGRVSYQFLQIANQQLFLPCALLFVIKSLKQIVLPVSPDGYVHPESITGFLGCNVNWIFVVIGVVIICTNLQRRFGHASNLCKITCVANLLQVVLIVARAYINDHDPQRKVTPAEAFPTFVNDSPGDRGYWADVFTALSSFGYCYVPIFIATEAMQEMKVKEHANRGLWGSTLGMFVLYAVVGVCPVLAWGWQRQFEVLSELQGDIFGRLANIMLFLASGMDFLITAISLNQRLQENIDPDFDPRDWSGKTNLKWFLFSMPSLIVTFLMLCFIPDLNSLVGLMTAFVVPFSQIIGPALLTLLASRQGLLGTGHLRFTDWILIILGICVGTVMLVVGGASTIKSIFFSGPLIKGNFFCDAVAG